MEKIPLSPYRYSYEEAKRNGAYELEIYQQSLELNIECSEAIENIIDSNSDGYHLKQGIAKEIID